MIILQHFDITLWPLSNKIIIDKTTKNNRGTLNYKSLSDAKTTMLACLRPPDLSSVVILI